MNHLNISFGGHRSPRDYRDVPLAAAVPIPTAFPDSFFLDLDSLPVWHQRQIGACVGHAIGKHQQRNELVETHGEVKLSARFLYALAKSQDGIPAEGTYPRLVAKILQKQGCATEATVPNDTALTHAEYIDLSKIPAAAYEEAKKYSVGSYAFPAVTEADFKTAIMAGGISMLARVGREWWTKKDGTPSWVANDILPIRPPETIISGHEVFAHGWETVSGRMLLWFVNSWSKDWGSAGKGCVFFDEYKPFIDEGITFVDLPDDWLEKLHQLPNKETFRHYFGIDLGKGMRGEEVKALQTALMIEGDFDRAMFATLLQSSELGYFGGVTEMAVKSFQKRYGIITWGTPGTTGYGRVGPKTRKKLNELFTA